VQAVILAAGSGLRLRPITETVPKGLVRIDKKSLLQYSLDILSKFGIHEVIMVVGYLSEKISKEFGEAYKDIRITYLINKKYDRTGSMYSFSRARRDIGEDIILLESDLLYEPRAVELIINSPYQNCLLVAPARGTGDEVYICIDKHRRITDLGKHIHSSRKAKALGELVGISRFSLRFLEMLFIKAEEDYQNGKLNLHYEECVFAGSTLQNPVYALFGRNLIWTEIDTTDDLVRARESIFPRIKSVSEKISTSREQNNGD